MSQVRYALRTNAIADCRAMWSVGGAWSAEVPGVDRLLTGPEVDALYKRHPEAQIVDVVVYRAACAAWMKGFRSVVPSDFAGVSGHQLRTEARAAGDRAVSVAGYRL